MYRANFSNGGAALLGVDKEEALAKLDSLLWVIEGAKRNPDLLKFRRHPDWEWEFYRLGNTYALMVKGLPPVTLQELMVETIGQNEQTEA